MCIRTFAGSKRSDQHRASRIAGAGYTLPCGSILPAAVSCPLSTDTSAAAAAVVVIAAAAAAVVVVSAANAAAVVVSAYGEEKDQDEDPAAAVVTEIKTTHNIGLLK